MSVVNLKDEKLSLQSSGAKNATTPNLNDPNVKKAMDKIKFSMGLSHLGSESNKSKSPMGLVSEPGSLPKIVTDMNHDNKNGGSCSGSGSPSSNCSQRNSNNSPRAHIGERFNPETIAELNYFAYET
jgi:hypothetical protein